MIIMWLIVALLSTTVLNWAEAVKSEPKWDEVEYHQDDYDMTLDIAELIDYNRTYLRDPKIAAVLISRTQRALNGSFHLLQNLTKYLKFDFQVYKFMSNEYRYFPLSVTVNLCDEYNRNLFNCQGILKNVSNINSCPIKKGYYYVKNALAEISKLPPFIPRGSYKSVWMFYHKSDFMARVETRGRILDKPSKWWN